MWKPHPSDYEVVKEEKRPYIRRSVWDEVAPALKWVKRKPKVPQLTFQEKKVIASEHAKISASLTKQERASAKRLAWKTTKQLRAAYYEGLRVDIPDFEGDEIFPPFSINGQFESYADVVRRSYEKCTVRVKPARVEPAKCICAACNSVAAVRDRLTKAYEARVERRQVEAQKRREERRIRKSLWRKNRWFKPRPVYYAPPETHWARKIAQRLSDIESQDEEEEEVPDSWEDIPLKPLRSRLTREERDNIALAEAERLYGRRPYVEDLSVPIERDPELLGRLRNRIAACRAPVVRAVVSVADNFRKLTQIVSAPVVLATKEQEMQEIETAMEAIELPRMVTEMERSPTDVVPNVSKASNVVLQEALPVETENIGAGLGNLRRFCEADTVCVPEDQDRWYEVASFDWNTVDTPATILQSLKLPHDVIWKVDEHGARTMREHVMSNEFRIRQYMMSDMVVRCRVNATPMHIGQLQMAWFYQADLDEHFDLRKSNESWSQTHHILVDAADPEPKEIIIPYRNFRSYVNIYPRDDLAPCAYIGTLIIGVLNKLNTSTTSSNKVHCVVEFRFQNCQLMGMIPPSIASRKFTAEMLSAAMAGYTAYQKVKQIMADNNRDQLPNPAQPQQVVITASGSLSTGKNDIEPVIPLRLDALAQTPHPELLQDEQFSVSGVVSKFGFVKTVPIPATLTAGSCLVCWEAAPILEKSIYGTTVVDGTTCYRLPPVAVVSQLYTWWRGDIEFRLDFIATQYHSVQLFICWIPGYLGKLTYEEAKSTAGVTFDVKGGQNSIVVKVPFIADKPWWPHRYSSGVDKDEVKAPSQFCIYIKAPLTYNGTISNTIDMNVYMRGGSNFEVAIPCQPTIGLSFEAAFKNSTDDYTAAYNGYYPWYVGTWNEFEGGKLGILRYGPVTQHIAQFVSLKPQSYYRIKDINAARGLRLLWSDPLQTWYDGTQIVFVPIDVDDGYGLRYLGVILQRPGNPDDEKKLQNFFCEQKGGKWNWRKKPDYDQCITLGDTSGNTYYSGSGNLTLVREEYKLPTRVSESDSYVMVTENDTREKEGSGITFESHSMSQASVVTYGEDHKDFKDLCRRYQYYHYFGLGKATPLLAMIDYSFPLLPQGLTLDPLNSDFQNMTRDGIIPILLSGYRFYRGGLRLKFLPSITEMLIYHVQIKPDRRMTFAQGRAGGKTTADSTIQHGYASAVQSTSVNPVLTVEVPFYLPGNQGLLQRPSVNQLTNDEVSRFFSLGEVCVSVSFPNPKALANMLPSMTVMYCFADDFSPNTFQGFPPMCFISDSGKSA